jgi:hypothetical protein
MWLTAILDFFLDTAIGRAIMFGVLITAAVATTYFYVDGKAYDRGYDVAKAECQAKQSTAKGDELNARADQAQAGSDIAAKADAAGENMSKQIDTQTQRDKDSNHEDYQRQKPVPSACAPVAVPAGVQARIDAAVGRSND